MSKVKPLPIVIPDLLDLPGILWALIGRGYKRSHIYEQIGVSQMTFTRWLSGESEPTYSQGMHIKKLFEAVCDEQ